MKHAIKFLIKILHFIRKILTILRNNCLPTPPPPSLFLLHEIHAQEEIKKCYETFKTHFKKSILLKINDYHRFVIERAKENDEFNKKFYLEFGVYTGTSINFFSKYVNTIYGFDSFEGLREDWVGTHLPKSHFNLYKKVPKLNKNIIPIVGWVQDTLVPFLEKHKPSINFVHMDMDTYETTKFVLTKIKPYLLKNCIIAFDELYNFSGWEEGEYKALKETFNDNEYKYVCFCINRKSAAIQII